MNPNYEDFWFAFMASESGRGLRSMARYSPDVERLYNTLRIDMLEAVAGHPVESNIQDSILRLLAEIGSQMAPESVAELAPMLQAFGLSQVYVIPGITA